MNETAGCDVAKDKQIPRFSGPCKGCGATNYGLSTSGPDYCGSCACGRDPNLSRLQRRVDDLSKKYAEAQFAVGLLTGFFPPFNEQTKKIAETYIARRKAEWEAR